MTEKNITSPITFLLFCHQHKHWTCRNSETAGALWLRMCKFYALEYDNKETVICIRQRAPLKRAEKKWTKRLPIEGEFQTPCTVTLV